jgi:hypothetical protein
MCNDWFLVAVILISARLTASYGRPGNYSGTIIKMVILTVGFCVVQPLANQTNIQIISEMMLPEMFNW